MLYKVIKCLNSPLNNDDCNHPGFHHSDLEKVLPYKVKQFMHCLQIMHSHFVVVHSPDKYSNTRQSDEATQYVIDITTILLQTTAMTWQDNPNLFFLPQKSFPPNSCTEYFHMMVTESMLRFHELYLNKWIWFQIDLTDSYKTICNWLMCSSVH